MVCVILPPPPNIMADSAAGRLMLGGGAIWCPESQLALLVLHLNSPAVRTLVAEALVPHVEASPAPDAILEAGGRHRKRPRRRHEAARG